MIDIDFEDLPKCKTKCIKCNKFKKPSTLVSWEQTNLYKTKCKKCSLKDFKGG